MTVLGIDYNFFIVLFDQKCVGLLVFSFLQGEMCAPQRFHASDRAQSALGAQFVQACRWVLDFSYYFVNVKGTVIQIQKTLINDQLGVPKVC